MLLQIKCEGHVNVIGLVFQPTKIHAELDSSTVIFITNILRVSPVNVTVTLTIHDPLPPITVHREYVVAVPHVVVELVIVGNDVGISEYLTGCS